ncbi:MAG: LuxR C-terminal-related transcriptional regulator, partial [Pseudomonadota bacterium]
MRIILAYAAMLGVLAAGLQWLDSLVIGQHLNAGWHMLLIAVGFAILGGWLATRLMGQPVHEDFEPNTAAIKSLGLTQRECEVLEKLAEGQSYKEIARSLDMSPNTVKTHVSHIYRKLDS